MLWPCGPADHHASTACQWILLETNRSDMDESIWWRKHQEVATVYGFAAFTSDIFHKFTLEKKTVWCSSSVTCSKEIQHNITKQQCSRPPSSELISPTAVLSFYVPLLLKEFWVCLGVRMWLCLHFCNFRVNRTDARSLSELFVLQREHITTGSFVWTDKYTFIYFLSFFPFPLALYSCSHHSVL